MTQPDRKNPLAMIVDDATTVRLYHRKLVEEAGWDVIEAENGMEALERSAGQQIDLMLVDVNMPIMDGYSYLRQLRGGEDNAAVPCVMISTEAQLIDSDKAFDAGANHYLVKPARPEQLLPILSLLRPEATS